MWTNGTARHGLLWRGWRREGLNKGDFQRTRSCILSTRKGTQEVGMTHARTAPCSSASDTHQKCMSKAGKLGNFKMDRKRHPRTVAIIFGKHLCQPISNFNAGTNTIRNCQNTSSESADLWQGPRVYISKYPGDIDPIYVSVSNLDCFQIFSIMNVAAKFKLFVCFPYVNS